MQVVVDFIIGNLLACIIALVAILILIAIIVVVIVHNVKKNSTDELEKLLGNIPDVETEEVAVSETDEKPFEKTGADLKWLREACFNTVEGVGDGEQSQKENIITKEDSTDMAKKTTEEEQTVVKKSTVTTNKAIEKTTKTKTANKGEKSMPKTDAKAITNTISSSEKLKTTAKKLVKESKLTKKVVGKWVIREKGEGEFVAYLHANNGEIVLTSEIYSTADGAKKGVLTIQKSILSDTFQIYCDKNRNYYFKLKSAQNRFLCVGETYPTKASCLSSIESVKRFSDSPIVETVEKDLTVIKYKPAPEKNTEKKSGYNGKWVVVEVEGMYIAQLFASNGELLLSSESYTTVSSAKSAIETITANGLSGNFIIDTDKKGRYFFKLRNVQKSTLCMGETYDQQAKCINAIESVRRFLKTAKLTDEVI